MARKRSIDVQAINIRLHDKDQSYVDLIKKIHELNPAIKIRGDTRVAMHSLQERKELDETILYGTFIRFTQIDPDADWYDEEQRKVVKSDSINDLSIPKNVHPNSKAFFFKFIPSRHKLVFEVRGRFGTVSGRAVLKFIREAFKLPEIVRNFGHAEADLIAGEFGVEQILTIHHLRQLTIIVKVPNPDDLPEGLEERVRKRLLDQNAKSETTILQAAPGASLEVSEDTKNLTKVAALNGDAIGKGRNENGTSEERHLEDFPLQEGEKYDPDLTSEEQAFENAADRVVNDIGIQEDKE